jgi:hypothetical protein
MVESQESWRLLSEVVGQVLSQVSSTLEKESIKTVPSLEERPKR